MTQKGIETEIRKQLFEALNKIEKLENKLENAHDVIENLKKENATNNKENKKIISELRKKIEEQKNTIDNLEAENKVLKGDILRLCANNQKDSSNSSKPSSTNGYKNIITNRREPSKNKPGKPKGESSTNLSQEKFEKFCNSGDVEHKIVDINRNKKNKNKPYKSVRVLDIKIVKQVIEYRYYPNENGTFDISEFHNSSIQWGPNLKTICAVLNNDVYNSTDGIVRFISNITNKGIIVKDGTDVFYTLALFFAQCVSHILRYLKGIYDFIDHKGAKKRQISKKVYTGFMSSF